MVADEVLSESTLRQRFTALPATLQNALNSAANLKALRDICSENKINNEENVVIVTQLTTLVLLGFITIDDFGAELNEGLDLHDPRLAEKIAKAIGVKIFAPVKKDIENNYQPFGQTATTTTDIAAPTSSSANIQSAQKPSIIKISEGKPAPEAGVPTPKQNPSQGIKGIPAALSIDNLQEKGWSRITPPDIKPKPKGVSPVPVPKPFITPIPIPTPSKRPNPLKNSFDIAAPVPVMIQQGENFAAPARNADFHLERKMEAQMNLESAKVQQRAKPAMIEFGQARPISAPSVSGTIPTPHHADAYPGFTASLASVPVAKNAERNITEVTAETKIPVPPTMSPLKPLQTPPLPKPPSPPKPPTPKVIVQNFTG